MKKYETFKKFKNVARLWLEVERKPHDFGDGNIVYHSEVFLLFNLNETNGLSVTELAGIMNMTKGTVSELLKKLDKKGLIIKKTAPENASKMIVTISEKGKDILQRHDAIHDSLELNFRKYYDSIPDDKIEFLNDFFTNFEFFLKEINKSSSGKIIKEK